MIVYHGSYIAIDTIDFSFCKKRRDFGKGFYVTKILSQAEYWSNRKGEDNDTNGVVTEFVFDEDVFNDNELKILRFSEYSNEWLDFVVSNRMGKNIHNYDMVEGPVADDDITTRIYDYINNKVSKNDFLKELKFRQPSHQICFCSLASLQALEKKEDYNFIFAIKNITKAVTESLILEKNIETIIAIDLFYSSQTFVQLSDKTTKLYLKPYTEIYELLITELNIK